MRAAPLTGTPEQGAWTPFPPSIDRNPLEEYRDWKALRDTEIVQPVLDVQRFGPLLQLITSGGANVSVVGLGAVSIPGYTQAMDRRAYAKHSRLVVEVASIPPAGFGGTITLTLLKVREYGTRQIVAGFPTIVGTVLLGSTSFDAGDAHRGFVVEVPFPGNSDLRLAVMTSMGPILVIPTVIEAYALPVEAYDRNETHGR